MPVATAPSKTGHTFSGYFDAASGGTQYYASDMSSTRNWDKTAANVTLYAQWTAMPTYAVTYNGNGSTGGSIPSDENSPYPTGATVTVLDNTGTLVKAGSTFAGWNTAANGSGTGYAAGATFTMGSAAVTLYAQWTAGTTYDVTGSVIYENTKPDSPVTGATVYLKKGSTQYGSIATTGADGYFIIYNVPAGTYNLFIEKGDKVITYEVTVGPGSTSFENLALPTGDANSNLIVKTGTPAIVVDLLKEESNNRYTSGSGAPLKIEMTVERTDKASAASSVLTQIDSINQLAQNNSATVGLYLEISVDEYKKTASDWTHVQNIPETNDLIKITIPIPTELQGKDGYRVYRYHGASVSEIGTDTTQPEYMVVNRTNWTLTLYVKKFSVYAIAYTNLVTGGTVSTGSTGEYVTYQITKSPAEHGSITLSVSSAEPGTVVSVTLAPDKGYKVNTLKISDSDGHAVHYIAGEAGIYRFTVPSSNVKVTASFLRKPYNPIDTGVALVLQTKDHIRYINGYPDGTIRAEDNMTRAEAAQMFYNLLINKNVQITASFSDVKNEAWYATAVKTLASMGIITGSPDGRFAPDDKVTREQFVTMAARFVKDLPTDFTVSFTDVTLQRWSYSSILATAEMGWINGYSDNTFKPGGYITRAEIAQIVNNILLRSADKSWIDSNTSELRQFSDLTDRGKWYYYTMREASEAHDYSRTSDDNETWLNLK